MNIICNEKMCISSSLVQNSNIRREHTKSGSRARCLRRRTDTLPNHEGDAVKAKANLELNLAGNVKGNKDFSGKWTAKKRLGKM